MTKIIPVRNIPKRYLKIAPQKKTIPVRDKETGMFEGRKAVNNGGDSTRSRYLIHDVDLNRNGKIDANEHGGTLAGRQNITVRASKRASGYRRSL